MIKKSIIFFVIVFVSFFIYQKKFKNSNLEIWDLVPAKSVMIIEINNPLEKWNKFSSSVNEDQFRDFRKLIDKNIFCWFLPPLNSSFSSLGRSIFSKKTVVFSLFPMSFPSKLFLIFFEAF